MDVLKTLYGWYESEFNASDAAVERSGVRVRLGYVGTPLVPRKKVPAEFQLALTQPWKDAEVKQAWIDRFTAGHNDELQRMPSSVREFLRDCRVVAPPQLMRVKESDVLNPPHFSRPAVRRDAAES